MALCLGLATILFGAMVTVAVAARLVAAAALRNAVTGGGLGAGP